MAGAHPARLAVTAALLGVIVAAWWALPSPLLSSLSPCPHQYGVVLDAGSSGTRAYLFRWDAAAPAQTIVQLRGRRWRPGISSCAGRGEREIDALLADNLRPMLQFAMDGIPEQACVEQSPVLLRATAGLRLLPASQRERVLLAVRRALAACPLQFADEWAGLIDGPTEAAYMWVGMNVLNGTLGSAPHDTTSVLDLGGGSTQIAVGLDGPPAADGEGATSGPMATVRHEPVGGGPAVRHHLCALSLLGFGQNSIFDAFLAWAASAGERGDGGALSSACLFGDQEELSGALRGSASTSKWAASNNNSCPAVVARFFQHAISVAHPTAAAEIRRVRALTATVPWDGRRVLGLDNYAKNTLSLFSLDAQEVRGVVEAGTLVVQEHGSTVASHAAILTATSIRLSRQDLLQRASHVCQSHTLAKVHEDLVLWEQEDRNRQICFGAAYISTLLDAFGVPAGQPLMFAEHLGGVELTWALGAMAHHTGAVTLSF